MTPRSGRDVLDFILSCVADDLREPGAIAMAGRLARLRDGLREQLPRTVAADDDPYAVEVEAVYALDQESFWIRGWLHDADHTVSSLVAVSPEGSRADLLDGAYRYERLDIQERFAAFGGAATNATASWRWSTLAAPSHLATGWIVELRTSSGVALEVEAPAVERRIERTRAHLLHDMGAERPGSEELVAGHLHPALQRIQSQLAAGIEDRDRDRCRQGRSLCAGCDGDRAAVQAHRLRRAPARALRARPGAGRGRPPLRARLARARGQPAGLGAGSQRAARHLAAGRA